MLLVIIGLTTLALANSKVTFESFMEQHDKEYHPRELLVRKQIYNKNVELIRKHNKEADNGLHSYRLAVNEYADMTSEEFTSLVNGYRNFVKSNKSSRVLTRNNNLRYLPSSVDWRKQGYVTGIKNQGECGSCWAFSATGAMEGQHFKSTGNLVSLSESQLVDCSLDFGNDGCNGGLMDDAFKYVIKNNGIDSESSYPYSGMDGSCQFKSQYVAATISSYTDIQKGDESALQIAVATIGPISAAMDASHFSFQFYHSGIYDADLCSSVKLDHGVLVIGYGELVSGSKYWLVKNSWGTSWGLKGYFMLARDKGNKCGIATQASYPIV